MNKQLFHRCRILRAGAIALGFAACAIASFAVATEQLTNRSFETAGGVGWTVNPLGAWNPFASTGEVYLNRSFAPPNNIPVKMLWQDLNINNVGGVSGTAKVLLRKDSAPPGVSTKVYLDYIDNSDSVGRLLLLEPNNSDVPQDSVGILFTNNSFSLPANARTITGLSVDRTGSGQFYAMEFSLDLVLAPPVPVVTLTNPTNSATLQGGVSIPLVASVAPPETVITGVKFYDGVGTLIGSGQPGLFGNWSYADGSTLEVAPDGVGVTIHYSPTGGEGMYVMTGVMWSDTGFQGSFTHTPAVGDPANGAVNIGFTPKVDGTLTTYITSVSPLGVRTLDNGTNPNPQHSLFWHNAAPGQHVLTAQADYGTGQQVTSTPVTVTVLGVPVIVVEQPDQMPETRLTSGANTIGFVQCEVGTAAQPRVIFTVRNSGTAPLNLTSVTTQGTHADDFMVTIPPATPVLAAESTTFTVTCTPSGPGTRSATLKIVSNDLTNTPFYVTLSGYGLVKPVVGITSPTEGASFADGLTIQLTASVESPDAAITGVEFYDGTTLIGSGQPNLNGQWGFADGSSLYIWGSSDQCGVDYTDATMQSYGFTGPSLSSTLTSFGTLTDWSTSNSGPGGVDFTWGSNNTLNVNIYGMVLGGMRNLTGGTGGSSPYTCSWPNAGIGTHALTARAYYGAVPSQYVTSAAVYISVTGGSGNTPFQDWMILKGVLANAGPEEMPHGDGVTHLAKYAFNMDPGKPDATRLRVGAGETSGLPGATRVGGRLRIEYLQRKAGTNPGITYMPQFCSILGDWTDFPGQIDPQPIGSPADPTWERVVVDDPISGTSKRYGRLRVIQTP